MGNENKSKKKIWRIIPLKAHGFIYAERMTILQENFRSKNSIPEYFNMPDPKTDFENEIYKKFFELNAFYNVERIEYVVPLIKEFIIDNKENEAAILFRFQTDFEIGKGFQMKEIVLYAKKGQELLEIYQDETWVGPSPLDESFSKAAKTFMDPMLYLLRGSVFVRDVDFHGLKIGKFVVSFSKENGEEISIKKP